MFHLTWKGMLGRKKESSLLLIVLMLSFLLSSALAIILPSTQAEAQLQREKTYGSWQVMLLDRSAEDCQTLAELLREQGAQCAVLPAAHDSSDEIISVMTPEVMALGSFELLDGRLPEAENEILIVEDQFALGNLPKVGDSITVRYIWNATSSIGNVFQHRQTALLEEIKAAAFEACKAEYLDEYYAYIEGLKENMANDLALQSFYRDLTEYCISSYSAPVEPQDMTPEQLDISLAHYLAVYAPDRPMRIAETTTVRPILVTGADYPLSLACRESKATLNGEAFGEQDGETIVTTHSYDDLSANVPYTVCGILKAYEATWDTGGHALPDAFLSESGRAMLNRNLNLAREQVEDLNTGWTPAGNCILLRSDRPLAELYAAAVEADQSLGNGYYSLYTYFAGDNGLPYDSVEFWGWDPVAEEIVIRQGIWEFAEDGTELYIFPDVLDENGQPFRFTNEEYNNDFEFPGLTLIPDTYYPGLEELYQKNDYNIRINTYALPDDSASAAGMTGTVLNTILVLISACAVLVICVVQSKRRAYSIVMLRAIGLQNKQAAVMQLTEALLFLLFSLLLGLPLGYLGASAALRWHYHGSVLAFDWIFLLRSVVFGALALLAGLQIPLLYSLRLPLTGKTAIAVKKEPKRAALRRGTLTEMERAAARFNRRRCLLARLLCALSLLLTLLTLLLAHFAFDTYRINVERADLPDYVLTATYGMNPRFLAEKLEDYSQPDELGEVPSRIDSYLAAEHVHLAGYTDSPILSYLNQTVSIAGMAQDSRLLEKLLEYTGDIDLEKLLSGEGCILLMPNYRNTRDDMLFSSDLVDAYRYASDDTIRPGDILHLSADSHMITESGVITTVAEADVKVLAVLHEYPGVWLFESSAQPGVLVSGQKLISAVYPNAKKRYSPEQAHWDAQSQDMHCPYCHGKTVFQFYASDAEDHTSSYWNLSEQESLDFKSHFRERNELRTVCENQRTLTVLLGAAAVLLVLIILLFILSDMAEQERRRIGVLRALGASKGAIRRTHWLLAMQESLRAVLLANAAYALILLGCAFFETGFHTLSPAALVTTLTQGLLWQYPWSLHLILSACALVLIALLRALPYQRLCRQSVIGTIKGLERGE